MMTLTTANNAMNGRLMGTIDDHFASVQFDSRKVKKNDLFFAIRGLEKDGHHYIDSALENGALAVVMDESGETQRDALTSNAIVVEDTTAALGDLARYWRTQFVVPVVGITGSNGKTTVSRILREIFAVAMPGIAPEGSFNNHWGVPMTLLKLRENDQSAVIEMGMNHPGELSYLGAIVNPTIGVITNAAAAHLEGLKTVDGVAVAKGELIQAVEENGWVVLNRDDAFYSLWLDLVGNRKMLTFGLSESADVQVSASRAKQLDLTVEGETTTIDCALLGEHNHLNVAAASAAALCAGMNIKNIKSGVQNVKAVNGRLEVKPSNKVLTLIDDTYNANPASMRAAINVLTEINTGTTLVLGTMGELGKSTAEAHFEIGRLANQKGVGNLVVFCDNANNAILAKAYVNGFGVNAVLLTSLNAVSEYFYNALDVQSTVLIKGSRAAQMERVVALLQQEAYAC
ncbi:MAG: UDP-N-acetylmuramoyl-tripeptide--D-alanyl-D-alanine ligase [Saprospiraceae bacterium]|jgi:UDP-N-acetylmuramoyl-tripeptide--D-alanyl-D-alanine ligase